MTRWRSYSIAFVEGAAVVSVELIGGKMLAPVFGSSLYIWTSVIGVTLLSLTLGYFLGGSLSVKKDLKGKLFLLLAIAAVAMCAMPFLAEKIFLSFLELNLFVSSVLMAFLLLSIPLVCLGATTALLIQLQAKEVSAGGKLAGRFYALSTLGGIVNTFSLGFFIIPSYGVRIPLLVSCAVLLLATWLIEAIDVRKRALWFMSFLSVFALVFFLTGKRAESDTFQDVYRSEGIMGQLKVVDYWSENNVLSRALLSNNSAQSIITKANVTAISQYNYVHFVSSLSAMKPEGAKVLLLGMAGGSLVYELQKHGFHVDVVDIDDRMFHIAERYFYFQKTGTDLFTDDARHYIRTTKRKYDVVIVDISSSELQPSYLYTKECFSEVKDILSAQGFFFVNFQGILEGPSQLAVATWSVFSTLRSAGFNTYYYSFNRDRTDDVQFVSCPDPINFSMLDSSRLNLCCMENQHVQRFLQIRKLDSVQTNTGVSPFVLTDDKPLLEKLKFETVMESRNLIRKDIQKRARLSK